MGEILEAAKKSLSRVQEFEPSSLVRRDELGKPFELSDMVVPARKLVELYKSLPLDALDLFPESELRAIEEEAASTFKVFSDALRFDPSEDPEPAAAKKSLIAQVEGRYQPAFTRIHPFIAFSVARKADFRALADEGRAKVQSIEDTVSELVSGMEENARDVSSILEEARKNLAEQGVSQEAFHFNKQADEHKQDAEKWRVRTGWWAVALGVYAALTVFLHKVSFFAPANNLEAAQLIVSKILLFGVIAFMLSLSAKNYLSHRHNEVVNRHRQNALMTYRSLVEAGATQEARDIILQQAATAIYHLQDTGYIKPSEKTNSTITELIPRASLPLGGGGS